MVKMARTARMVRMEKTAWMLRHLSSGYLWIPMVSIIGPLMVCGCWMIMVIRSRHPVLMERTAKMARMVKMAKTAKTVRMERMAPTARMASHRS